MKYINSEIRGAIFLFSIALVLTTPVYAGTWYAGVMHVHTGFSTDLGYPGVDEEGCDPPPEGIWPGFSHHR